MGAGWCTRRRLGRLLLVAVMLSCFALPVRAGELYVGDGGYQTIQEAVDAAGPGDTIVVGPGTYSETVTVSPSKAGLKLVAETRHAAELTGAIKVEADGVSIDGFYVRSTSGLKWTGIEVESGVGVSIINTRIEGFAEDEIKGVAINASGGGQWRFAGEIDVDSDWVALGVSAHVGDDATVIVDGPVAVSSLEYWADGVSVRGGEGLSVFTKQIAAAGEAPTGVYVDAGSNSGATLKVDGDVTVTGSWDGLWAFGVMMTGGDDLAVTIDGDVSVTGGVTLSGVWIEGEERAAATLGGVRVEGGGEDYIRAVIFAASRDGALTVQGDVVAAGDGDALTVEGLRLHTGDYLAVNAESISVSGGFGVTAVKIWDPYFTLPDNVTVAIDGDIKAAARARGHATGIELVSGNDTVLSVSGAIRASGGWEAYGAAIMALNGADITFGDIKAESDYESLGVYLDAADGGRLKVGKVTAVSKYEDALALGLQLYVGDETAIEVESIAAEAHGDAAGISLLAAGNETIVSVADGLHVRSYGEAGSAVGLWLDDFDGIDLSLAGESVVQADGRARGVVIGGEDSGREAAVRNSGLLKVLGEEAAGIDLSVEERAAIENSGTIDVAGGIAVDARASTGVTELRNDGVIQGDVHLGAGDDLLVVGSTGRIIGQVDLGGGDDKAMLHSGAVVGLLDGGGGSDVLRLLGPSSPGPSLALGVHTLALDVVSEVTARNFERVVIEGGRWSFGEGAELGTVEITGGVLGGDAALPGSLHNISGIVAPGHSFGVVTIAGDYRQGKEGLLSIEVGPAADPQPGVDHDQLVVGGKAKFEPGTTIQVVPLPGTYPDRARYVIVDGVLEEFDPGAVNLDFPRLLFLRGSLEEGSLAFLLVSAPFASIAESRLQRAVASALDRAKGGSDTDLDGLYDWLHLLTVDEKQVALKALGSISGEVYGFVPAMAARSADRVAEAAIRGIGASSGHRRRAWAEAYSDSGQISRESGAPGARLETQGYVAGADLITRQSLQIGLAAGGGTEVLALSAPDGALRGQGYRLGVYGRRDFGRGRLTLFAGYGTTSYASDREAGFGAVARRAKSEFDADSWFLWAEAGLEPVKRGGLTFEPAFSLGWLSLKQSMIKEEGAGSLSLTVDPYGTQRIIGRVGVAVKMEAFEAAFGKLAPHAKIAWVNDFAPKPKDQTARLLGAEDAPFGIPVSASPTSGLEIGLGVGGSIGPNAAWSLDYTAEHAAGGRRDRLQGRVEFTF